MRRRSARSAGASLVEVLTAVAVLAMLLAMMMELIGSAARAWGRARERGEMMRMGRDAMALMARDLASVCRAPGTTNLLIQCGEGDGCYRLAAVITRPGEGGDVCAVAYRMRDGARRGSREFVRSWLVARDAAARLRAGRDPLAEECPWRHEVIAAPVRGLRFVAVPEPPDGAGAFVTNLPSAIDVTFDLMGAGGDGATPFRSRLPLR